MRIKIGNVNSEITLANGKEEDFLSSILTATVPNHQFMPAFESKFWDGKKRFYSHITKTFPTGFLPFIVSEFQRKKLPVEIIDSRPNFRTIDITSVAERYPTLRDYQLRGLTTILSNSLTVGNTTVPWIRGIVKLPTGGGKTLLACSLIDFLHKKTLYVVERKDLMYQTCKAFSGHTKMKLGLLGDGKEELEADIIFAMIQTLNSKIKKLNKFFNKIGTLVIDEAQHLAKGTYHRVSTKCNSPFRFGFSATPLKRGDLGDAYLIGDTGEIVFEESRSALEQKNYIATPTVYMFTVEQPIDEKARYQTAYEHLIVKNSYRNTKVVAATEKLLKKNFKVLISVKRIEHGEILLKLLRKKKIDAIFLKGKDDKDTREKVVESVKKSLNVIIATKIFDEGIDIPLLSALVRAGAGASEINSIQQIGRILRPKSSGDNKVRVVDFVDRTNEYLLKHSTARLNAYESEGLKVFFPKKV